MSVCKSPEALFVVERDFITVLISCLNLSLLTSTNGPSSQAESELGLPKLDISDTSLLKDSISNHDTVDF